MSDLNQTPEESNIPISTEDGPDQLGQEPESQMVANADRSETKTLRNAAPRPFKPRQFLFGLALSAGGIGLMLFVAAGALHDVGAGGAISLPATGLCMILGLMMLGGGFGQMAISSPRFDDTEFQRMLNGEMPDDDDEDGNNTFHSSSSKASSGLVNGSKPSSCDSAGGARTADGEADVGPSTDSSSPKKRGQTETSDNFVSTVLSDVVASHG